MLGGKIKKVTKDKDLIFLSCCVPCQSISNNTFFPADNDSNTGSFCVP